MSNPDHIRTKVFLKQREQNIGLRQLARASELSPQAIKNYRNGGDIKITSLCRLAKALGTTIVGLARK